MYLKQYSFGTEVCALSSRACYGMKEARSLNSSDKRLFHRIYMHLTNEILRNKIIYGNASIGFELMDQYDSLLAEFDEDVSFMKSFLDLFSSLPNLFRYFRYCKPHCTDKFEVIPHVSDCGQYYMCSESEAHLQSCPAQRVFNSPLGICLYFEENCSKDPSRYLHCRYSELKR